MNFVQLNVGSIPSAMKCCRAPLLLLMNLRPLAQTCHNKQSLSRIEKFVNRTTSQKQHSSCNRIFQSPTTPANEPPTSRSLRATINNLSPVLGRTNLLCIITQHIGHSSNSTNVHGVKLTYKCLKNACIKGYILPPTHCTSKIYVYMIKTLLLCLL